jgi:glycosyltransferase involved in cell wall biosynthesis
VERFARALHVENLIKYAGERASALDMLPEANAAIFAAEEEISMTPVAWCMAAGLPIIATAIPGVAEMLAHDHNALLVGDPTPKAFCERILSLRDDAQLRARLSQTVRGHAYEAFGVRRMVDQFEKLYDNLLAGRPAGEQILDSALVD